MAQINLICDTKAGYLSNCNDENFTWGMGTWLSFCLRNCTIAKGSWHDNGCIFLIFVGFHGEGHQGERDPYLHRRWEDLSPSLDRGEPEAAAEKETHWYVERERVQQLQVTKEIRQTRQNRLLHYMYYPIYFCHINKHGILHLATFF